MKDKKKREDGTETDTDTSLEFSREFPEFQNIVLWKSIPRSQPYLHESKWEVKGVRETLRRCRKLEARSRAQEESSSRSPQGVRGSQHARVLSSTSAARV